MSTVTRPAKSGTRLEPELTTLRREAKKLRPDDWREYEKIKSKLQEAVGWQAHQPELRTSSAYEPAHRFVFEGRS